MPDAPFNPLDKLNLAKSLAEAMLKRPVSLLPPDEKFDGAGVYAIYYAGDSALYEPIAEKNQGEDPKLPIYVGKAVPPGARKGGFGLGADPGNAVRKLVVVGIAREDRPFLLFQVRDHVRPGRFAAHTQHQFLITRNRESATMSTAIAQSQ